MTVVAIEWNGKEIVSHYDPYHSEGVKAYFDTLVDNGTIQAYKVI